MFEMRGEQVLHGIVEIIATHNLVKYVRGNTRDERARMAAGATLAGLGFAFGPELEERLRALPSMRVGTGLRRELAYAAGGAVLGAVSAHLLRSNKQSTGTPGTPPRAPVTHTSPLRGSLGARLDEALTIPATTKDAQTAGDISRPSGLVTVASAAWLGYSLFLDGKNRAEQHQHLWGLGAGALGYLYGPESLRWIKGLALPRVDGERAIGFLRDGTILYGAAFGGVLGYTLAHIERPAPVVPAQAPSGGDVDA